MPSKLPSSGGSGSVGFSQVPCFIRAARSLGRLFLLRHAERRSTMTAVDMGAFLLPRFRHRSDG